MSAEKKQAKQKLQITLKPLSKTLDKKSAFDKPGTSEDFDDIELPNNREDSSKKSVDDEDSDDTRPNSRKSSGDDNPRSTPNLAALREQVELLFCNRAFPSVDVLKKHANKSDLHRKVIIAKLNDWIKHEVDNLSPDEPEVDPLPKMVNPKLRLEERTQFGLDGGYGKEDRPDGFSSKSETKRDPEPATNRPLDSNNIGNKLLKSMGWRENQGAGKSGQGIVNPIEAVQRVQGAGLGSAGSTMVHNIDRTSHKEILTEGKPTESTEVVDSQLSPSFLSVLRAKYEMDCLDNAQKCCNLCNRRFSTLAAATYHIKSSNFHKKIVDEKRKEWVKQYVDHLFPDKPGVDPEPKIVYRDRAKERRAQFGLDGGYGKEDRPDGFSSKSETKRDPEPATNRPLDSNNIGNKLLKSMGWREGEGAGKYGQGIVNPIEAVQQVQGAGLGSAGSTMVHNSDRTSHKERVRASMMNRSNTKRGIFEHTIVFDTTVEPDYYINCEDNKYYVHKKILVENSIYYRKKFTYTPETEDSYWEGLIENTDKKTMRRMLQYFYKKRIDDLDNIFLLAQLPNCKHSCGKTDFSFGKYLYDFWAILPSLLETVPFFGTDGLQVFLEEVICKEAQMNPECFICLNLLIFADKHKITMDIKPTSFRLYLLAEYVQACETIDKPVDIIKLKNVIFDHSN